MADAVAAFRGYMPDETPDELHGREFGFFPDLLVIFDRLDFLVVLKGEPDDSVVDGENPGIRNGNSVGVSADIGDRAFRSVERFFRVYHPIFRNEFPDPVLEIEIVFEKTQFARKGKFSFFRADRSFSRKMPRNTLERAMTGNRKLFFAYFGSTQFPSASMPPAGTMK